MKYKVIKLENNKSVLVDESDTTKLIKGDWHIEKELIINQFPDYLTDLDDCKKIVATINHSISLDVPMVIVEDEGIIEIPPYIAPVEGEKITAQELIAYSRGWEIGFKAAQQKYSK